MAAPRYSRNDRIGDRVRRGPLSWRDLQLADVQDYSADLMTSGRRLEAGSALVPRGPVPTTVFERSQFGARRQAGVQAGHWTRNRRN